MATAAQSPVPPPRRRLAIAAFVLWPFLWSVVPALFVWSTKPYLRGPTISIDGRSHEELEAELNNRYAGEYLLRGGLLGCVGGVVAMRLRREWQVFVLSVAVGAALVAAFNYRNALPYHDRLAEARDGIVEGVLAGLLLGLPLGVAHRHSRNFLRRVQC